MMTERAESNFEGWKQLVGLSELFPKLTRILPTEFEKKFYHAPHHRDIAMKVDLQMGGRDRLAITFQRGHGCTTFHDYFFNLVSRDAARRRLVPIRMPLGERFWSTEKKGPGFLELFRQGLAGGLVNHRWDQVLKRAEYLGLMNGFEHENEVGGMVVGISSALQAAAVSGENVDWARLSEKGPDLTGGLGDIVSEFRKVKLLPLLFIDSSFDCDKEARSAGLNKIAKGLKSLVDEKAIGKAAASVAMFSTRRDLNAIRNHGSMEYKWEKIEMPSYSYSEIFGILNQHYNWTLPLDGVPELNDLDASKLPLSAIVDQAFVREAAKDGGSIREILARMEEGILQVLDCPWRDVPFVLHPPRAREEEV